MYKNGKILTFALTIFIAGNVVPLFAGSIIKAIKQSKESSQEKFPIVFHSNYDIGFFGIEKLHPFDSKKYGHVAQYLVDHIAGLTKTQFYVPQKAVSDQDLLKVHSLQYLESLKNSAVVERVVEIPGLSFAPNWLLRWKLLKPMRYATQGTIDAALLAQQHGVAINLGGGYHHAKRNGGEGFCVYADIPLSILKLREQNPNLKIMYIDLDAHQGNGVESFTMHDPNVYVVDCYNERNYPADFFVERGIHKKITSKDIYCAQHKGRSHGAGHVCDNCNACYLQALQKALMQVEQEFKPDFIFYNAGTDCFEEDYIGAMAMTKEGIIKRDQMVFEYAKKHTIPLCMTLSGGYSKKSAEIIGESIVNLYNRGFLKSVSA